MACQWLEEMAVLEVAITVQLWLINRSTWIAHAKRTEQRKSP
jgi:hypothetical protein